MEKTTKMVMVLVLGAALLIFAASTNIVEGRSIKEEKKYEPETFGNFFGSPGGIIGGAPGFGQPGVGSIPGYQPGFGSIPGSQPGFGSFPGFGNGPVMPGGGLGGDNGATTP